MKGSRSLPRLTWLLVAVLVLALDQATKALVRAQLPAAERIELLPFLDIRHVHNTGIAFGLFAGRGAVVLVGTFLVGVVLLSLLRQVPASDGVTRIAVGAIGGGAVGNLIDRARLGYVFDFLHLPHWPTFNVADIAIVVGVAVVIARHWLWPLPNTSDDAHPVPEAAAAPSLADQPNSRRRDHATRD